MKVLDTTSTNSFFTMDKTLNNTYNLYSAIKNDTILVNFGDLTQKSYQLNLINFLLGLTLIILKVSS